MGFLEIVEQAKVFLERNRRVSLRGLAREFESTPKPPRPPG
ncbi:MAG TPA: hypothetical protein VK714_09920 [Myxococcota bacterium]|nr:hypothetical protein [Myxococcota bacterium]